MLQTAPVTIAEQNYKKRRCRESLRGLAKLSRTTLERARPQALRGAAAHPDQALQGLRPVCAQAIQGSTDATGLGHDRGHGPCGPCKTLGPACLAGAGTARFCTRSLLCQQNQLAAGTFAADAVSAPKEGSARRRRKCGRPSDGVAVAGGGGGGELAVATGPQQA